MWSHPKNQKKRDCSAQNRPVRAPFETAQQPHSSYVFLNQKIISVNKLINQQEEILAYKVINGMYLLGDILTDRHILHHYQLRNDENLRIPLHSTTPSQLFICYNVNNMFRYLRCIFVCVPHTSKCIVEWAGRGDHAN